MYAIFILVPYVYAIPILVPYMYAIIGMFSAMPALVLTSKLVPKGLESTVSPPSPPLSLSPSLTLSLTSV
jgi:hypothetical protein